MSRKKGSMLRKEKTGRRITHNVLYVRGGIKT